MLNEKYHASYYLQRPICMEYSNTGKHSEHYWAVFEQCWHSDLLARLTAPHRTGFVLSVVCIGYSY